MKKIFLISLLISILLCACSCSGNNSSLDESKEFVGDSSPESFECEDIAGGLSITRYIGHASKVKIPSTLNNKKVVAISETAFSGNVKIEEIYLPETIAGKFHMSVFEGCDSLKKLFFAGHIEKFYSCELPIISIAFESLSNKAFSTIDNLIKKCKNLSEVTINSVSDFEYEYFSRVDFVKERTVEITIPKKVYDAILNGTSYRHINFLEDWEQDITKYTLRKNFKDEEIPVSDDSISAITSLLEEEGINLTAPVKFWKKRTITYSEHPSIVAISSAIFEGKEHIFECIIYEECTNSELDPTISYIYSRNVTYATQLDAANFCIFFGCSDVVVNGTANSI